MAKRALSFIMVLTIAGIGGFGGMMLAARMLGEDLWTEPPIFWVAMAGLLVYASWPGNVTTGRRKAGR